MSKLIFFLIFFVEVCEDIYISYVIDLCRCRAKLSLSKIHECNEHGKVKNFICSKGGYKWFFANGGY